MSLNEGVFNSNASKENGEKQNLALFLGCMPDALVGLGTRDNNGSKVLTISFVHENQLVMLPFEKGLNHSITTGAAQGVAKLSISPKSKEVLSMIMKGEYSDAEVMGISCNDAFSRLPKLGKNAILGENGLLKNVTENVKPILDFFENTPALEKLQEAVVNAYTDYANGVKKNETMTQMAQM